MDIGQLVGDENAVGLVVGTAEGYSVDKYEGSMVGSVDGPSEGRYSGEADGITATRENNERNLMVKWALITGRETWSKKTSSRPIGRSSNWPMSRCRGHRGNC